MIRLFICIAVLTSSLHASAKNRPLVIASFTVLADIVKEIAGPSAEVISLIGPGGDPHSFEPRPSDAIKLKEADLIVMNGGHFDHWMQRMISASETKAVTVTALQDMKVEQQDPHCWQSPLCGQQYADRIGAALQKIAPANAKDIQKATDRYKQRLQDLYQRQRKEFDTLPEQKKIFFLAHGAFRYFAEAYGLKVLSGHPGTTDHESPKRKSEIEKQVKAQKVQVVFLEAGADNREVVQTAKDLRLRIGEALFFDSLTKQGPGSTYMSMLEENGKRVLRGLQ